MRKTLTAIALGTTLAVGTPQAAHAAPAKVVTKAEFKKVKNDWAMSRVHKVFDAKGKQSSYYSGDPEYCDAEYDFGCPTQSREYNAQGKYSYVSVSYTRGPDGVWRLESKSAYWG